MKTAVCATLLIAAILSVCSCLEACEPVGGTLPCCPGWTVESGNYAFAREGSGSGSAGCNWIDLPGHPALPLDACTTTTIDTFAFRMTKVDDAWVCECYITDESGKACCTIYVQYGYAASATVNWTWNYHYTTRYCDGVHYCYGGMVTDSLFGSCTNLTFGPCTA